LNNQYDPMNKQIQLPNPNPTASTILHTVCLNQGRVAVRSLHAFAPALLANSFWLAQQRGDWYIATWAPHLYHFAHEASVPDACINLLRRHSERAQWDLDGGLKAQFALSEVDPDDLPGK
jgi:hypothetical protein